MRDGDLVVRAKCDQSDDILALIPSSKLREDLPPALVDDHVHWLNLSTQVIEICPLEQLWESSSKNWRIDCASGQYRLYRGCETLVDIRSSTWEMVSKCFECLNNVDESSSDRGSSDDKDLQRKSRNLLITTAPINFAQSASMHRLYVTLPRYDLSFFVNEREELESRDFKDMVYDENQCVGALFGLENLVLRPKTYISGAFVPEAVIPRRILIPNGIPKTHGNHQVRIDTDAVSLAARSGLPDEPLYHTYDVDTDLGCLIGNGSLTSMRCLAYLHAMTSCYRPDPLTGKTGAQAALCLLRSAGCRSIMKLKALEEESYWGSDQHPQIDAAYKEIRRRYYWNRDVHDHESIAEKHAAQRAAYLFPSNAAGPASLTNYDADAYLTTRVPAEPGLATFPHSISSFNECSPRQIPLDHLLCNRLAPELPVPACGALLRGTQNTFSDNYNIPLLDQLFTSLRADSSFQREYLAYLASSAHVSVEPQMTHKVAGEKLIEALQKHYMQCRVNYLDSLGILKKRLGPTTDPHEQALDRSGQWPPITADVLLRCLASTSPIDIPPRWKKSLISLALLLLELQRSRRLLRFALDGHEEEFSKELENEGCDGWNAEEYPDWLLIQVGFFSPSARP